MKALRLAGISFVAVLAACAALALAAIDAESVRDELAARLEAELGAPVELGAVHVSLLPLPGARIRDVRIGPTESRWVEAPELRAGVSLAGLLTGRVVIRSLELDSPRLRLPAEPTDSTRRATRNSAGKVHFAITHFRVRDGRLAMGALAFERVSVDGSLGLSRAVALDFAAELPGIARIEDGKLALADLSSPPAQWRWSAEARLAGLELREVSRRLGLVDTFGSAQGSVAVAGRGGEAERVTLALESADVDVKGEALRATGRARLRADLPGAVELELDGAAVVIARSVEKPAGVPLRVTGTLRAPVGALRFTALRIESPGLSAEGELDLGAARPALELDGGALDLETLAAWRVPEGMPRRGRLSVSGARVTGSPLTLRAEGELANVLVPVTREVTLSVSGPASAEGTTLAGRGLRIAFGEDALEASVSWEWRAERVTLAARAQGARIGPLVRALLGRGDISGRLFGDAQLAGGLSLETLAGAGSFELQDGELPGLSLARAAGLERTWENPPGLDRFQRLFGRFETAGDHWRLTDVHVEQEYATAVLEGKLWLDPLRPDLSGAVQLDFPELGEPVVRNVPRVGGTLDALEIVVSEETKGDQVRDMEAQMIEAIRKTEERERDERRLRRVGAARSDSR